MLQIIGLLVVCGGPVALLVGCTVWLVCSAEQEAEDFYSEEPYYKVDDFGP